MVSAKNSKECSVYYLGLVPYEDALMLQNQLVQGRLAVSTPNTLLLLQHTPVFTLGRFRGTENLLVSQEKLAREGIELFHTNRGGNITLHNPGQLVAYPIINLKEMCMGLSEYIWKLESVVIKTLRTLAIQGHRNEKYPGGVWVGNKKICSIGIRVKHHITMHGFALNVNNDLNVFKYANPCGLRADLMTSVAKLLGGNIRFESILKAVICVFAEVFGVKCECKDGSIL